MFWKRRPSERDDREAEPEDPAARARRIVVAYHDATKHGFQSFARGPFDLDWATQPDPFRRWEGAEAVALDLPPVTAEPRYEQALVEGRVAPRALDRGFVSQLLRDSLALSAWKRMGEAHWSLRVNPSSGNLHPTEGTLVAPPVAGLWDTGVVAHYAPAAHALELRARLDAAHWAELARELPDPCLLVGLSSVHWREAWKYGERAYRYCNHDAGHALACVALAAAGMGWKATLLDGLASDDVATLLGLGATEPPESEEPDGVLVLHPQGTTCDVQALPEAALAACAGLDWRGAPSALSPDHVDWDAIEHVAAAARKPRTNAAPWRPDVPPMPDGGEALSFRRIVRQRRSAVAMDGRSGLARDAFFQTLRRTLPARGALPFTALPWAPRVHLALFVHRVADVEPGLYLLVRHAPDADALRADLRAEFAWSRPPGCPDDLPLVLLHAGDVRGLASRLSCDQAIAGEGCFSLGMVARFASALEEEGASVYPRLFWECGAIGQVLYLEAEALGIRSTGIGCYYDDPVHAVLGLRGHAWQSLYHFTVGGAVDDPRIQAEPAYAREA